MCTTLLAVYLRLSSTLISNLQWCAVCNDLVDTYGIIPQFNWGTAPDEVRQQYDQQNCNIEICRYWQLVHTIVVPHPDGDDVTWGTWGSLPLQYHASWDANNHTDEEGNVGTCSALVKGESFALGKHMS
jgi:hypothetical protein